MHHAREADDAVAPDDAEGAARLWRHAGLEEHASIAAFARFVLQLLSLGAPPRLIRGAARALGDEITHAMLAFRVARTLDGHALGPGPLQTSETEETPEEILEAAIEEGCVAETVSAELARLAAELASYRPAAKALQQIWRDEARHADLAWEFVEWMLMRRPELLPMARRSFEAAFQAESSHEAEAGTVPSRYGQFEPAHRAILGRRAIEAVIRPRAEALLARVDRREQPAG